MDNVPERGPPVVPATLYCTVPLPLTFAPAVIVSHGAVLVALHAQPAALVTPTLPVLAPAATLTVVGSMVTVQPLACVSANVWPPMVSVAERGPPLVALTAYCTVPLPLPFAPEVIVSHGALLVALQAQSAPAVTLTLPAPPAAATFAVEGLIANEQPLP
jgi:hypothetical protein